MTKFFCSVLSTLLISTCSFAQVQSDCLASEEFKAEYKKDVEYLALGRIYELQSSDTSQIIPPQSWQDTIMNGLAAIYNTGTQIEADSIFTWYCFHNNMFIDFLPYGQLPDSSIVEAKLNGDYDLAWTTDTNITALSNQYGFQITEGGTPSSSYEFNWGWARFVSPQIINVNVFKDSLSYFYPDIYFKNVMAMYSDMIIRVSSSGDTLRYLFKMGWSDCPMGCNFYKSWYYSVYPGCMVTLDSTAQSSWTPYWRMGCVPVDVEEMKQDRLAFEVFPNPATDIVHIKTPTATTEKYDYRLYNSKGVVILSGNFLNATHFNLAGLAKGLYVLQIMNKAGDSGMQKILLQ